ncbi:SRPBCC family protein [Nesterenkonia alba]|uniref:SRPBCC family protein n=1 Tax=Nesterenkonia alba TaxID=515814 RepID=UPI0003B58E47|nr:SRPBCC family protein [Nesterenkonia alba]
MSDSAPPERVDAGDYVIAYTLEITAPPERIWAVVADPHRHHEFDGSGTVRDRAKGPHDLSEGDTFSVHMRKFGIPYRLPLQVTRAEQLRVLEWAQPTGHRWRWELDYNGTSTRVTEAYDASRQNPAVRALLDRARVPQQNAASIRASLQRLKHLME